MKKKSTFITSCVLFYMVLVVLAVSIWLLDHDESQLNALRQFAYNSHEWLYPNNDELLDLALNTKSISKFLDRYDSVTLGSKGTFSGFTIEDENAFQVYWFNVVGSDKWDDHVNTYISAWISRKAAIDLVKFIDGKSNGYWAAKTCYYQTIDVYEIDYWTSLMKGFYRNVGVYYGLILMVALLGSAFIAVQALNYVHTEGKFDKDVVQHRFFRCLAQLSVITELWNDYNKVFSQKDDGEYGKEGATLILWSNIYYAFCYLSEWVFAEEQITTKSRSLEEYLSIAEEYSYFECSDYLELTNFKDDLWKAKELAGDAVHSYTHSSYNIEEIIERISKSITYFRKIYRRYNVVIKEVSDNEV